VRQRHFDDVVIVTGAFGRPVAERRAETVDGYLPSLPERSLGHALEQHGHAHVRQARLARSNEDMVVALLARQTLEYFDGTVGQRNAMFLASFHALGGNRPDPMFEVYFVPLGVDDLARACSG
jgi:hypothetical protein